MHAEPPPEYAGQAPTEFGAEFIDLLIRFHNFTMNGGVVHGVEDLSSHDRARVSAAFEVMACSGASRAVQLASSVVESGYIPTLENERAEKEADELYYAEFPRDSDFDERLGHFKGLR